MCANNQYDLCQQQPILDSARWSSTIRISSTNYNAMPGPWHLSEGETESSAKLSVSTSLALCYCFICLVVDWRVLSDPLTVILNDV